MKYKGVFSKVKDSKVLAKTPAASLEEEVKILAEKAEEFLKTKPEETGGELGALLRDVQKVLENGKAVQDAHMRTLRLANSKKMVSASLCAEAMQVAQTLVCTVTTMLAALDNDKAEVGQDERNILAHVEKVVRPLETTMELLNKQFNKDLED